MNYSRLDYIRFTLFAIGQFIGLALAFFVSLISLGEYRIGVIVFLVSQVGLAFLPPIRGEDSSLKRTAWWGITYGLLILSCIYALITVIWNHYFIWGSWIVTLIVLWSIVGYWITSPTKLRFVMGYVVVAIFGVTISLVSLFYRVPFGTSGEVLVCEDTSYQIVEYTLFKGDIRVAYFQETVIPFIYSRPDWQSIGGECWEAGLKDDYLRSEKTRIHTGIIDAEDIYVLGFDRPLPPNEVLKLHSLLDVLYQSEVIAVEITMLRSPRANLSDTVIIKNPPSERVLEDVVVASVSEDTWDPMSAPIITEIQLSADEGSFDQDIFLALIDPRYAKVSDSFGAVDPSYIRERLGEYSFRGTGSYFMKDTVYREALFEFEQLWYDDFLKINQFVGSIFEFTYYNDYFYEVWFAVDRPFEWRDMAVQGGRAAHYSQSEFEEQYRQVVLRKARDEWKIDPRPEELDIYQNHLHRYVLFPDQDSEVVDRFDYLFGVRNEFSAEQIASWERELGDIGLSRERIQSATQETIQRGTE